uniref:Uncharacterized protein n=1 Tax=Chromera velia CCMP2878 TaxID=1169474 RepID=A0A0G4FWG8_9ALVE|eukprot:Cvel_19122.t1-p1 / transcript=Cvel_19122.t1 / gene=Cvel_19122 / organism=Chromera_velia_CCMP2878 / gene_product=hypothetical protein / transcript_product=hypothetical protein / location=Cvel_scaffold1625:1400-2857(-) / protein_length=486 / sequence_SO=supercontig / SO=protein_coding / is_pseudo=false
MTATEWMRTTGSQTAAKTSPKQKNKNPAVGGRRKKKEVGSKTDGHSRDIFSRPACKPTRSSIILPGTPTSEFCVEEGTVRGFGTNLPHPQIDLSVRDGRVSNMPHGEGFDGLRAEEPVHGDNNRVGQSFQQEEMIRSEMPVQGGPVPVSGDGDVLLPISHTTKSFDFDRCDGPPVMALAGGDGQMSEPAPIELCRIGKSRKEEGGVGKDLFKSLYRVGSWERREEIHSQRPHSASLQHNCLETGRQGNDFDGGNLGKAERQKQKRQEKKERRRQEKHEREMLAVRRKKKTDSPWSPLPPISEGVEEPAVSSDGLTLSHQARRQQERREAKDRKKEKKQAAHEKPKTPVTVPPRDPLQYKYWEDVSFRFRLGREDLIPNVQGIGTADWHAFLARRGCGQIGETFYRETYGNGGGVMPCVPKVRPAVRQMRSVRTAHTSAQSFISLQPPSEQQYQANGDSDQTDRKEPGVVVGPNESEMQYYGIQWTP